ncbi:unnamed protein product [Linum tenue]|uniref:DUF8040 domain-containing protein n=1 Tax=Linum tenue TaxID=586396 RepID=A0AAV0QLW3_9ROSI|nr:unnamed protein product [Linum tenue]
MDKDTFLALCEELKQNGGLKSTTRVTVEEKVAIFLKTIGHANDFRDIAERFQHSTTTISKYFDKVLKVVVKLANKIIVPPNFDNVQDCIGAIDGVHIDASVPTAEQIPYRGRKATTNQTVVCVCSFDMLFTFVVAGWEGTTNDARILSETVSNPDNKFPMPPRGTYYCLYINKSHVIIY